MPPSAPRRRLLRRRARGSHDTRLRHAAVVRLEIDTSATSRRDVMRPIITPMAIFCHTPATPMHDRACHDSANSHAMPPHIHDTLCHASRIFAMRAFSLSQQISSTGAITMPCRPAPRRRVRDYDAFAKPAYSGAQQTRARHHRPGLIISSPARA